MEISAERAPEDLGIADDGERMGTPARANRVRELPKSPPDRAGIRAADDFTEKDAKHRTSPREQKVRAEPLPLVNVLPAEQYEVLLEDGLNVLVSELLADGAAVLVIDDAARLVVDFPTTFPREITEVCVFEIKGFE